jgi:ABC-type transporter lipoprotein component MlaA
MKLSRSQIVALTCFLAGAMFAPSTVLAMDADAVDDDTPMTDAGEAYADELDDFDEFDEYALPEISDPFESFNRTMFKFNASAMKFVFRPITQGYEAVVPSPARRGLVSFF